MCEQPLRACHASNRGACTLLPLLPLHDTDAAPCKRWTYRTCRAVMFDHSSGSEPCRELAVAFTPRRLSMPWAHCGGSTPSILLLPMFLQQAGGDMAYAGCA